MLPQLKQAIVISPTSTTAAATTSGILDTLGFDFATIDVFATTADVVTNRPTVLKLSESDDTNATNFSDITAFVGGGAGGFVIPPAATTTTEPSNRYKFNVDCRARKRYLKVTVSPATTQTVSAVANLGRAEQSPVTAAKANVNALVEG